MPIPLIAAALSAIAPQLAQKGLDLLSGVFRGAVNKRTAEIANLIQERTRRCPGASTAASTASTTAPAAAGRLSPFLIRR